MTWFLFVNIIGSISSHLDGSTLLTFPLTLTQEISLNTATCCMQSSCACHCVRHRNKTVFAFLGIWLTSAPWNRGAIQFWIIFVHPVPLPFSRCIWCSQEHPRIGSWHFIIRIKRKMIFIHNYPDLLQSLSLPLFLNPCKLQHELVCQNFKIEIVWNRIYG